MKHILLCAALGLATLCQAAGPDDSTATAAEQQRILDSVESTFHYQRGKVELSGGLATLQVAKGFKFLNAEEGRHLVENLWGNMADESILGVVIPEGEQAVTAKYAFIVKYEPIGYVKDKDAGDINYDDLLKDMKEESVEANKARAEAGMEPISIIGWAAKPRYDADRKLLYWAKEIRFGEAEVNTLNYDIRLLGRKGVLVLQAVSEMTELPAVNDNIENILGMVTFNKGNTYNDFDADVDEVAAWTIGGLVAGKVLAKAGIIALVLKNIKLIAIGAIAGGGALWKWITGRRRKEEEEELVPVPAEPAPAADPAP